jgi:hypothetical protein
MEFEQINTFFTFVTFLAPFPCSAKEVVQETQLTYFTLFTFLGWLF